MRSECLHGGEAGVHRGRRSLYTRDKCKQVTTAAAVCNTSISLVNGTPA
jgi:hypothetical protein